MNQKKLEEYSRLLKDSEAVLQGDVELWKQFLRFAAQFTHYRFRDQLLIYAQNQQASACATFDQWKKIEQGKAEPSEEISEAIFARLGMSAAMDK